MGKESVCNAEDIGDADSILGLWRSPGEEMAAHSSILAWKIPWTEEPGGLQSLWGLKDSDTMERLSTHILLSVSCFSGGSVVKNPPAMQESLIP